MFRWTCECNGPHFHWTHFLCWNAAFPFQFSMEKKPSPHFHILFSTLFILFDWSSVFTYHLKPQCSADQWFDSIYVSFPISQSEPIAQRCTRWQNVVIEIVRLASNTCAVEMLCARPMFTHIAAELLRTCEGNEAEKQSKHDQIIIEKYQECIAKARLNGHFS